MLAAVHLTPALSGLGFTLPVAVRAATNRLVDPQKRTAKRSRSFVLPDGVPDGLARGSRAQSTRVHLQWMRCISALQTCLALLLAFFLAPFEHVHAGQQPGTDHDHAGTIHAHFYSVYGTRGSAGEQRGPQLVDPDDDHAAAWSLDTFTLVLTAGLAPFVPSRGPVLLFVPSETFAPVEVVEECGHDPPCVDRSIPRAPPS